jgi:hypothetical protein
MENLESGQIAVAMDESDYARMHNRIARSTFINRLNDSLTRMTPQDIETVYLCLMETYLLGKMDGALMLVPDPPIRTESYE